MLEKNIKKEERKSKRKPPIPYTRKGPTKNDLLKKEITKYKNKENN